MAERLGAFGHVGFFCLSRRPAFARPGTECGEHVAFQRGAANRPGGRRFRGAANGPRAAIGDRPGRISRAVLFLMGVSIMLSYQDRVPDKTIQRKVSQRLGRVGARLPVQSHGCRPQRTSHGFGNASVRNTEAVHLELGARGPRSPRRRRSTPGETQEEELVLSREGALARTEVRLVTS